jgi:DNA-binding response OmpR family regulator
MPKLLVVDDEPSILHFFRRAFPGPDVTLLTASSAAEGLAAVGRDRPDVVVLDVNLGGESGLDTFRRIHAADQSSSSPGTGRRTPPSRRCGSGPTSTCSSRWNSTT